MRFEVKPTLYMDGETIAMLYNRGKVLRGSGIFSLLKARMGSSLWREISSGAIWVPNSDRLDVDGIVSIM